MDFMTLLEDHGTPTGTKTVLELQQHSLDNDHTDLDMQALRDREEIQLMRDEDPEELYELAWETASEDNEEEEEGSHQNEGSSSYFEDYDSDEYFSEEDVVWDSDLVLIPTKIPTMKFKYLEDGSFLPELEEHRPKSKPSILAKAARFLRRNVFFNFGRPDIDMSKIRWMKKIPDDLIESPQMADKQTKTNEEVLRNDQLEHLADYLPALDIPNYRKTIQIHLLNGLNRYNVNFDIDHKETSSKIAIRTKLLDKSRSTIYIHASDDRNKTFQKLVRSCKSEMMNKPPKDIVIHLSNGLRLSSLNIQADKSEILIKIHDESWREIIVKIDDHYPILSKTLRYVKLEEHREKQVGKQIINAELSHGLSLSNTEVNCCYKRSPEVEFTLPKTGEATLVNISDGTSTMHQLLTSADSEIAKEPIGDDMALKYRRIDIRLSHIKLGGIALATSWKEPDDELLITLKLLSKTNAQCIIFDQDKEEVSFDIKPTNSHVQALKNLHYPPWEFQDVWSGTKKRLDEINIDLKSLHLEQISVSISKPSQDEEVFTDGLRLRLKDADNSKIQIVTYDGVMEEPQNQTLIVFRMDEMFNSDVFKIVGVHGTKNNCGTNITTFYGRLAIKEAKFVMIRVFDAMHVLENFINLETNHTKHDYFLRKTRNIKLDDHHCNLSIFLKNITCEEITLHGEYYGFKLDQNISFSLTVTNRHPIKVLLSNDVKTLEHDYGRKPQPARREVMYTDLSEKTKVVILKLSPGLSIKHVNFIWEELHCLVYDDLKQKITIVVLNEDRSKILLNVAAKMSLLAEEEGSLETIKTIDLYLPFDIFDGHTSIQSEYTIFELDVYNNSPIILNIINGDDILQKKMHVGVNVTQESRRTRAKFRAKLHQLEEALKSEITTRYRRQIDHCVERILELEFRKLTSEEKLERQSKEAIESISRVYPLVDNPPEGETKSIFTFDVHKLDDDFYDDIKSRLKNLKDEDERCVIITGKQPSKYLDHIDKVLEEIDQLKPTSHRFKFEIDQKCFSCEDEALVKEALDQIEEKILEVKEEIKPEVTQEKDLTEEDSFAGKPLKGKLLHGDDGLNHDDKPRKPRKSKKNVEEPIVTDCAKSIDEYVIVEMPDGISIEIEEDVDAAFKYYSELIPNLNVYGQHILGEEEKIEHSQEMPLVVSEEAIPTEICEVPVPESYTGSSEIPSTSAQQEVTIPQNTNATKVQYFKCDYCPQTTTGKNHLLNHNKNHNQLKKDPDYFCLFCGRGFKTNGWLKKHIEERHKDKVVVYALLNLEIIKLQN